MKGITNTTVLVVVGLLSGQVLRFADDGAASGAVAVQEPEAGTTIAGPQDATEDVFAGESEAEDLSGPENAAAGQETQSSDPADDGQE